MEPKEFPTGIADIDLITLKQLDSADLANLQEISPYLEQLIQKEFWDKVNDPDHIITSLKGIDKSNYSIKDDIETNGSINFYLEGYPHSRFHKLLDRNGFNVPPSQIVIRKFNNRVNDRTKYLPDDWETMTMLQYVLEYIAKMVVVKMGKYDIVDKDAFCFISFDIEHDHAEYERALGHDIYHGAGYEQWIDALHAVTLDNAGKDLKLIGDLVVDQITVRKIMNEAIPNLRYKFVGNTIEIPLDNIRQQML